jgi:prolipoprotein diacylglyceryltransferase
VLPLVAPTAIFEFSFDPVVEIGGISVRLETIGVAVAILAGLVIAALIARQTPLDLTRPADAPGPEAGELNRLRADDLLYIAVAAFPGAVIGGRVGYALVHLDFYGSDWARLLEVGEGGFQLSLAVVGGLLTASVVASLLGAPLGRWMHAMAMPLLLVLAGGKAAMVLGGTGQGQLTDVSWATAYLGPGPWGSLAPQLPAHPAQAYEALATIVVLLVVAWFLALGAFAGRNGGAFLLGLGLWAVARALVAITWRDPQVVGPLRVDQVISIVIACVALALMATIGGVSAARGRRRLPEASAVAPGTMPVAEPGSHAATPSTTPAGDGGIEWPDPQARPRI